MENLLRTDEIVFLCDMLIDIRVNGSKEDADFAKAIHRKLEKYIDSLAKIG